MSSGVWPSFVRLVSPVPVSFRSSVPVSFVRPSFVSFVRPSFVRPSQFRSSVPVSFVRPSFVRPSQFRSSVPVSFVRPSVPVLQCPSFLVHTRGARQRLRESSLAHIPTLKQRVRRFLRADIKGPPSSYQRAGFSPAYRISPACLDDRLLLLMLSLNLSLTLIIVTSGYYCIVPNELIELTITRGRVMKENHTGCKGVGPLQMH